MKKRRKKAVPSRGMPKAVWMKHRDLRGATTRRVRPPAMRNVHRVNCKHDFQFRRWVCTITGVSSGGGTIRKTTGLGKTLNAAMQDGFRNMRARITFPANRTRR